MQHRGMPRGVRWRRRSVERAYVESADISTTSTSKATCHASRWRAAVVRRAVDGPRRSRRPGSDEKTDSSTSSTEMATSARRRWRGAVAPVVGARRLVAVGAPLRGEPLAAPPAGPLAALRARRGAPLAGARRGGAGKAPNGPHGARELNASRIRASRPRGWTLTMRSRRCWRRLRISALAPRRGRSPRLALRSPTAHCARRRRLRSTSTGSSLLLGASGRFFVGNVIAVRSTLLG